MKLFFGDWDSFKTVLLVFLMLIFIGFNYVKRNEINHWGMRILILFVAGLYTCVYAATRDGFHLTVQNVIDGSTSQGLFSLGSLQSILGSILGIFIVICCIISIFINKQSTRQFLFFLISGGIMSKVILIELSRIIIYLRNASTWFIK